MTNKKTYSREFLENVKKELNNLDIFDDNAVLEFLKDVIIEKLKAGASPKKIHEFLKQKGIKIAMGAIVGLKQNCKTTTNIEKK